MFLDLLLRTKTSTPSNKHKDEYIEQPAKQNRESVYFDANGLLVGTKYSRNSALPEYSTKTSGNHTNNMMMMIPIKTYKESNNPKSFYENYAKENDKRRKEGNILLAQLTTNNQPSFTLILIERKRLLDALARHSHSD